MKEGWGMSLEQGVRETVLVVDDNAQNRRLIEANLTAADYAVVQAESGERALAAFETSSPSLVLLDVLMPGISGFETCKRMRCSRGGDEVAIVFLTALNDLGAHHEAMASGADDFLTKPINRTELLMRVRSLLAIRRLKEELKRGYELIRRQRDALLAAQKQKEETIAFIVHDLKNPLASILANAGYLAQSRDAQEPVRDAASDIIDAGALMNRMVTNLLDIGRSEDGVLVPNRTLVDVPSVIEQLAGEHQRSASLRGATLETSVDVSVKSVSLDEDLFRRLVENLIDNAIRHSPRGGAISIEVGRSEDGVTLEVRVRDQGPGVPEDFRERIFDKYVRLVREGSGGRTSRGLGLAFCRVAAEALGGRVWVERNERGEGSVFVFRAPIRL